MEIPVSYWCFSPEMLKACLDELGLKPKDRALVEQALYSQAAERNKMIKRFTVNTEDAQK